ncbi:MAG: signal peptidase I [Acidobacteriota bacterium]
MNKNLRGTFRFVQPVAMAIVAALLIRATILQTFSIPSNSMWPALQTGDHIVVTPYGSVAGSQVPRRGDVIVFRGAGDDRNFYVKRIVALPGEEIRIDGPSLFINGHILPESYLPRHYDNGFVMPRVLRQGEYFVMGDCRNDSIDSRDWGPVAGERVVGQARLIFWSSSDGSSDFQQAIAAPGRGRHPSVPLAVHWSRLFRLIHGAH